MNLILWTLDEPKDVNALLKTATPSDKKSIRVHMKDTLPETEQGDLVLAMGARIQKVLLHYKLVQGGRTISSLRYPALMKMQSGADLMMTYSLSVGQREYDKAVQVKLDWNLALRKLRTGSFDPMLGKYRWVDEFTDAISFIEAHYEKTKKPMEVALDTETVGLNPYAEGVWIVSVQVAYKAGMADAVYIPSLAEQRKHHEASTKFFDDLRYLLTSPKVSLRGANLKYDLNWIWVHYGISCTNFKFDTMVAGSLLDENRGNSLNLHTKWYVPELGGYDDYLCKKYKKDRMDLIPKDDLLPYAAGDADACYRVAKAMKEELVKDSQLSAFYVHVLHPALRAYEKVERIGMLVDVPYYLELECEIEAEIERLEKEAFKIIGGRLCAKHSDKLSLSRPALLKDFLFTKEGLNLTPQMFTEKEKEPSTSMDHLMMFSDRPKAKEFIDVLDQWSSAKKTLSTYVVTRDKHERVIGGFLSHLRPDCRFHPTYFLHNGGDKDGGTNTGRISVRDPAIQCQRGSSLIYCEDGVHTIKSIVEGFEGGRSFRVKSHTGEWRRVVGVYRNGIRPVYEVTTKSGLVTGCTANHPLLLDIGFVRTDRAVVGDFVFVERDWHGTTSKTRFAGVAIPSTASGGERERPEREMDLPLRLWGGKGSIRAVTSARTSKVLRVLEAGKAYISRAWQAWGIKNLPFVVWNASSGSRDYRKGKRPRSLPWSYHGLSVERLCEFSFGHGGGTHRNVLGSKEQQSWVLQGQLPMGNSYNASSQSEYKSFYFPQWADSVRCGVGRNYRVGGDSIFQIDKRVDRGGGIVDSERAAQAGFVLDQITSIRYVGEEETFDLTVEEDHSFVSDGIVVHNTIPKHSRWAKKLRRAYIAPPGMLVLSLDYSQGELKIAACLAEEPTMLEVYSKGIDLHAVTAANVAGLTLEQLEWMKAHDPEKYSELRQLGKPVNFGFIYGMSAEGFQNYAKFSYGIEFTIEQAINAREAYFIKTYTKLLEWHKKYKTFARQNGFVRSPLGRVRHLPLIASRDREMAAKSERQAVNAPVQATLSDMSLWATAEINRKGWFDKSPVVGMVHDQLIMYVPEDNWEMHARRVKQVMENLPFEKVGWEPQLKFEVDVEVGPSLGELKKVKLES